MTIFQIYGFNDNVNTQQKIFHFLSNGASTSPFAACSVNNKGRDRKTTRFTLAFSASVVLTNVTGKVDNVTSFSPMRCLRRQRLLMQNVTNCAQFLIVSITLEALLNQSFLNSLLTRPFRSFSEHSGKR